MFPHSEQWTPSLQTVTDKNFYLEYLVKTKQKKKQTPYLSPSLESVSKEIINKGNDPIILRSSYASYTTFVGKSH
jgi:hypothetical protein